MSASLVGSALVVYYVAHLFLYLYLGGSGRHYTASPGELVATALVGMPLLCLAIAYLAWWSRSPHCPWMISGFHLSAEP